MSPFPHSSELLQQLGQWADDQALRDLDLALARFIHQELPDTAASVLLVAALVSAHNGQGHVCLNLAQALAQPAKLLASADNPEARQAQAQLSQLLSQLSLNQWLAELTSSPAVYSLLNPTSDDLGDTPLVLAGSAEQPLLYLRRYWRYEQQILQASQQRLAQPNELPESATRALLDSLFKEQKIDAKVGTDWQKIACLLAARSNFAIITGGPGTGKTTTVVRLLALLQGLQLAANQPLLHIRLAAPTGKAAARLSESIIGSIKGLILPEQQAAEIQNSIPKEVTTLHRLLGSQYGSRKFKHHAGNPLPVDLVVVDEASMMDVDMMARLTDALPVQARLILLGDKDQLASVEAGSVLADLCQGADQGNYLPATAHWVQRMAGEPLPTELISQQGNALHQAICMLRHSYRFAKQKGIGALATLVNQGQASAQAVIDTIQEHPESLDLLQTDSASMAPLEQHAVQGYSNYLQVLKNETPSTDSDEAKAKWAEAVFTAHNSFQLLAAVRKGPYGVDKLNPLITRALQRKGLLPTTDSLWYHGRPVMVTRNDYSLKLMNGDIGLCMQWPDGNLRVAFQDEHGSIRWVLPSRLQEVQTVFAMTVHKSQGSEFTHTSLVMPDQPNPVLTKELVYTAITRSKEKFTLINSSDKVLAQALSQQVSRNSGLA